MVPTGSRERGLERQKQHVRENIEKKGGIKDRKARRERKIKRKKRENEEVEDERKESKLTEVLEEVMKHR